MDRVLPIHFVGPKMEGLLFVNENISITGAAQFFENGLSVTFTSANGHGLGIVGWYRLPQLM